MRQPARNPGRSTVANRTLISDKPTARSKTKRRTTYLHDADIFPAGPTDDLLEPHFITAEIRAIGVTD